MPDALERLKAALADRYRIERELGQGGMATVYLAEDLKHDRKVALKVLKPELAAVIGADRFVVEIKTTAQLQHPHILPLFDSGTVDGFLYYVMPFIDGETLRTKLDRERQLGIDEALRITTDVADALDYAHRHGVIHRDIKPENILLHDGRPMVADFGIALALSAAAGGRMTETGMSLGTPHYMSPEQATAERELTGRSDIYSLASCLYEMLAGDPPHTGATAQQIIMKIIAEPVRLVSEVRRSVPDHIADALAKALEKLPADRFATAAEFANALKSGGTTGRHDGRTVARTGVRAAKGMLTSGPRWVLPFVGVTLVAVGLLGGRLLAPRAEPIPAARFVMAIPPDQRLSGAPVSILALSPDGGTLVFTGETPRGQELFIRRLQDLQPTLISNTEAGSEPRFSRDGRWLAYFQGTTFKRMPAEGGPATNVALPPEGVFTYTWDQAGGFYIATQGYTLAKLLPNGTIDTIAVPDTLHGELGLVPFDVLPDGSILVIVWTSSASFGPVDAIDPKNGSRRRILTTPAGGAWYGRGALVWTDPAGALFTAAFDPKRLTLSSEVTQLSPGVRVVPGGIPEVAVAPSGAVAFVPAQPTTLVQVGREGNETPILDEPKRYHSPRVSPDGRRIVYDISGQSRDVWLYDRGDRTSTRLTFQNDGHDPTWMPDGKAVTFMTARGTGLGVFRSHTDGSGTAESLAVFNNFSVHSIGPDGKTAVGSYSGVGGSWDLVALALEGTHQVTPILATRFWESHGVISPDGHWLAYQSNESGRLEVYVRSFPTGGGRILVSQGGGMEPVWARSGRELFYFGTRATGEAALIVAGVAFTPDFHVTSRTALFSNAPYELAQPHANYDVFPDGRSFAMVRQGRLGEIVYLQNWPAMMQRGATPQH
ncbi:MAG TPA: protein kinase [Gemmatimonadales bacterium]|jgi:serine/threonine-protein kinase|nr:protein kinase [Gemmatimonadales bacterium]